MDTFNVKNLNGVTWISSKNFGGQAATDQLFEAWKALAARFIETARFDSGDGSSSDADNEGCSAAVDPEVFIEKHDLLESRKNASAVNSLEDESDINSNDVSQIWDELMMEPTNSAEAIEIDLDDCSVGSECVTINSNRSASEVFEGIIEEPEDDHDVATAVGLFHQLQSQSTGSTSSTPCPSASLTIQEVPADGLNSSDSDSNDIASCHLRPMVSPPINQEQRMVTLTEKSTVCDQTKKETGNIPKVLEACLSTLVRCDKEYNQVFRDIEISDAQERPWDRPTPRFYKPKRKKVDEFMFMTIMQDLGYQTEVSERLEKLISVDYSSSPFMDDPLLEGLPMPLIGPPIPATAVRNSAALAVLVTESSTIGRMQGGPPGSTTLARNNLLLWKDCMQGLRHQSGSGSTSDSATNFLDCVFRVCFYHPVGYATTQKSYTQLTLSCKIDIRGQQTLQELRKVLYCRLDGLEDEIEGNDLPLSTEFSLQQSELIRERNMLKPCAFFIGSTVYHNKHSDGTSNANYTEKVNRWNEFVRSKATSYTTGEMEATKLIDLDFQLGFPYGFFHLDCCEHIFTIESVRLLHTKTSIQDRYPRIRHLNKALLPCEIDGGSMARYVVNGFKTFLRDTMLVCHECLQIACYQDGKKNGDFRVCRFHQVASMKNADVNGISTG